MQCFNILSYNLGKTKAHLSVKVQNRLNSLKDKSKANIHLNQGGKLERIDIKPSRADKRLVSVDP